MAAEGASKNKKFNLRDPDGNKRVGIIYRNQEDFLKKCKDKFKVKDDEEVIFIEPDSEIEVLAEDIFDESDGSWFVVKKEPKPQNDGRRYSKENIDDGSDSNDPKDKNTEHGEILYKRNQDRGKKYRDSAPQKTEMDSDVSKSSDVVDDDKEIERLFKECSFDLEPLESHMKNKGVREISEVVQEVVDKWKCKPVNIAVIGQSGKGKSTLINTMLGMKKGGLRYAETGTDETTMKSARYEHPDRKNFVLWDFPGVFWGGEKCKENKYNKEVKSDIFDFFLIVFAERVHENDVKIAEELISQHKNVYFVRNKFDADLSGQMSDNPKLTEKEIFEKCRKGTREALVKTLKRKNKIPPLFIISALNVNVDRFDYQEMISIMYDAAAESKKDCFALTIKSHSKKMTEVKAKSLRFRWIQISQLIIWKISSALCDVFLPKIMPREVEDVIEPCLDCFELKMVVEEIQFYSEQFGLDDDSLIELAARWGMNVEDLKHEICLESPSYIKTAAEAKTYLRLNSIELLRGMEGKALDQCIPQKYRFMSSALSAVQNSFSVYIMYTAIDQALVLMKEDACRIIDYFARKT